MRGHGSTSESANVRQAVFRGEVYTEVNAKLPVQRPLRLGPPRLSDARRGRGQHGHERWPDRPGLEPVAQQAKAEPK